jgi:hypothetical protein
MGAEILLKDELVKDIDRNWSSLQLLLSLLTEDQRENVRDTQGWSVKDHVIHLEAWERSVVSFLQGKARHEGLGVDEVVYLKGGFDEINDVIFQQRKNLPWDQAMAQFDEVHQQLYSLLGGLTDEDLQKPYRRVHYDEADDGEGPTIYELIYGNSAGHYEEHQGWIEALFDARAESK